MKWLLVLAFMAAAVAAMFGFGWIYVQARSDKTEIIIDNQKVQRDAERAVEEGREFVEETTKKLERDDEDVDPRSQADSQANVSSPTEADERSAPGDPATRP